MRLARAGSPAALIDRLFRIDATRAPLHPMLLEGWIGVFGASEAAARASSVLCGVATVLLVFDIGRVAFDTRTGLWAAWLAALSPALIVYSREARMYAWLVLVTCLCWRLLLGLRRSFTTARAVGVRPQPGRAGVFAPARPADAGDARAGRPDRPAACFGSWRRWLAVHLAAAATRRALGPPLPRSSARIPERPAPAPVPPGHADRVHRRQLRGSWRGLVVLIAWGHRRWPGRGPPTTPGRWRDRAASPAHARRPSCSSG